MTSRRLWAAILPEGLGELPELLRKVDELLDDEAFFAPFHDHFHPLMGRPSIPVETCLRLMFLKYCSGATILTTDPNDLELLSPRLGSPDR